MQSVCSVFAYTTVQKYRIARYTHDRPKRRSFVIIFSESIIYAEEPTRSIQFFPRTTGESEFFPSRTIHDFEVFFFLSYEFSKSSRKLIKKDTGKIESVELDGPSCATICKIRYFRILLISRNEFSSR